MTAAACRIIRPRQQWAARGHRQLAAGGLTAAPDVTAGDSPGKQLCRTHVPLLLARCSRPGLPCAHDATWCERHVLQQLQHTTLATAGRAQQRAGAGVHSQHRRGVCGQGLTAVVAALQAVLPHSCSGAWDAARLSAAPQVRLSWAVSPASLFLFNSMGSGQCTQPEAARGPNVHTVLVIRV
jgi:hypothetical protein